MRRNSIIRLFILTIILIAIGAIAYLLIFDPTEQPTPYSRIAFVTYDGDDDIYTMNPDGSNVVQLTRNDAEDFYPLWSPDGSRIAFLSDRSGNLGIYTMNADGTDQTFLTYGKWETTRMAWSPDGSQLAYNSLEESGHLLIINTSGGEPVEYPFDWISQVSWSPDDTHLTFHGYHDDAQGVFILDLSTGEASRIPKSEGSYDPTWLPDGERLLMTFPTPGTYFDRLCIVHIETGEITPIAENLTSYSVSPSGRYAAASRWNDQDELVLLSIDLETGTIQEVAAIPYYFEFTRFAWSPDESQIAFRIDTPEFHYIAIANRDGSGWQPITPLDVNSAAAVWSPWLTQPIHK